MCVCTHTHAHLPSRDIQPVLQNVRIGYLWEVELQRALIFFRVLSDGFEFSAETCHCFWKTYYNQTTDVNSLLPFFPLENKLGCVCSRFATWCYRTHLEGCDFFFLSKPKSSWWSPHQELSSCYCPSLYPCLHSTRLSSLETMVESWCSSLRRPEHWDQPANDYLKGLREHRILCQVIRNGVRS